MVLVCPDAFTEHERSSLLPVAQSIAEQPADLPPIGVRIGGVQSLPHLCVSLRLVKQVHHPVPHRVHDDVCSFAFEEGEHVEVAVSFGELRPKLSCDANHRLHPQSVKLDLAKPLATAAQRLGKSTAVKVLANFTEGIQRAFQRIPVAQCRCKPSRRTLLNLKYRSVAQQ